MGATGVSSEELHNGTDRMMTERADSTVHAVITGGAGGIGASIARALLSAEGVKLTLMGRSEIRLREQVSRLPGSRAVVCDVTREESVRRAFAESVSHHGAISVLINNAGVVHSGPLQQTSLQNFMEILNVNLIGAFLCSREVLAGMVDRRYGRIINISSTAGLKGYPYVGAYCAAKHGLIGLTRSLALEVAEKGIMVNAICPGYTDTDLLDNSIDTVSKQTGRSKQVIRDTFSRVNPQGGLIHPDEVASITRYLALRSPNSITGAAISVDGGEMA